MKEVEDERKENHRYVNFGTGGWLNRMARILAGIRYCYLAGRYFGGLLKICHLAEFTFGVEPVLATMIFIAKWLIKCAGNLTRP